MHPLFLFSKRARALFFLLIHGRSGAGRPFCFGCAARCVDGEPKEFLHDKATGAYPALAGCRRARIVAVAATAGSLGLVCTALAATVNTVIVADSAGAQRTVMAA